MRLILPSLASILALTATAAPVMPKAAEGDAFTPRYSSPARSAEEPQGEFTATNAVFWNYGDFGSGSVNYYRLILSNMEVVKGNPVEVGQMCRITILADIPTNVDDPLPAGTYNYVTYADDLVPGSMIGVQSDFLDVSENPADPSQLYAYQWLVTGGSVTIEKVGGPENGEKYPTYTVTCDMTGEIVDQETGEVIDTRPLSATYSGVIPFEDPNAYTPIGHDVKMTIPNLSGRFSDGGQWTLTFYGLELDPEGYIIGAGELFNVELVTEDPGYMNCELLPGTYTPGDMFGSIGDGNFGKGVWYNLFGWQTAIGTALSIYDERATLDRVGLAEIGEITVSEVSDEVYHFDFDVTTPEGDKLTGSWEGRIKDFVADRSSGSGVEEVYDAVGAVKGCRGYIEAPEGARVFNAAGIETGTRDLAAGIYIVRLADRAVKVVVK